MDDSSDESSDESADDMANNSVPSESEMDCPEAPPRSTRLFTSNSSNVDSDCELD